jgi:hypothetical protein
MYHGCISRTGTLKTNFVQLRVAPHIDADFVSACECKVFNGTRVKVLSEYLDFVRIGTEEHPPRIGYVAKEHVVFYTDGGHASSKDATSMAAGDAARLDCPQTSVPPIPSKIVIMNCTEGFNAKFVNGVFEPSKEIRDGFPVYVKTGDDRKKIIEHHMGEWQIKPLSSKASAQLSCICTMRHVHSFPRASLDFLHCMFVTSCSRRAKTVATPT